MHAEDRFVASITDELSEKGCYLKLRSEYIVSLSDANLGESKQQ